MKHDRSVVRGLFGRQIQWHVSGLGAFNTPPSNCLAGKSRSRGTGWKLFVVCGGTALLRQSWGCAKDPACTTVRHISDKSLSFNFLPVLSSVTSRLVDSLHVLRGFSPCPQSCDGQADNPRPRVRMTPYATEFPLSWILHCSLPCTRRAPLRQLLMRDSPASIQHAGSPHPWEPVEMDLGSSRVRAVVICATS